MLRTWRCTTESLRAHVLQRDLITLVMRQHAVLLLRHWGQLTQPRGRYALLPPLVVRVPGGLMVASMQQMMNGFSSMRAALMSFAVFLMGFMYMIASA